MGCLIKNLVLVGMPGSGKSTVGVVLAKKTSMEFTDTDVLIQTSDGRGLQEIVDRDGYMALRKIEEKVILELNCESHVIATGGSAVYSSPAMSHLKSNGVIVFLDADLDTIRSRIHDFESRGLAKRPEQSFDDLYEERSALYRKHAALRIDCAGIKHEEVCARIIAGLKI